MMRTKMVGTYPPSLYYGGPYYGPLGSGIYVSPEQREEWGIYTRRTVGRSNLGASGTPYGAVQGFYDRGATTTREEEPVPTRRLGFPPPVAGPGAVLYTRSPEEREQAILNPYTMSGRRRTLGCGPSPEAVLAEQRRLRASQHGAYAIAGTRRMGSREPLVLGPSSRTFRKVGLGSDLGDDLPAGSTAKQMCLCNATKLGQGCAVPTGGGAVAVGQGTAPAPAANGGFPVGLVAGGLGVAALSLIIAGVI
jgi:hypothetical protein